MRERSEIVQKNGIRDITWSSLFQSPHFFLRAMAIRFGASRVMASKGGFATCFKRRGYLLPSGIIGLDLKLSAYGKPVTKSVTANFANGNKNRTLPLEGSTRIWQMFNWWRSRGRLNILTATIITFQLCLPI